MTRRLLALLITTTLFTIYASAQSKKFITVTAGHTIKGSLSPEELYQYPQFEQGTVFLKNGKSAHSLLNYNRFLDELQFINTESDTLSLNNVQEVQFAAIGTDTFLYNNGIIKLVSSSGHASLAIKQTLSIVDREKMSDSYGSYSSTGTIDSYNYYNDGSKTYNLIVMQNIILANKVQYYIGKDDSDFVVANKKSILKLFPEQKNKVETYLKQNAINFDNSEDLIKLIQYLSQL